MIRVVSEETQENVRESLNLSRDEAEEISFVPSAISIPQRPMFWCDNRCSDKAPKILAVCFDSDRRWCGGPHRQFVPAVLQREFDGTGPGTVEGLAVEGIDDRVEVRTVNLWSTYNESLDTELAPLKNWQWEAVVEKKAHRGRPRRMLGIDQYVQGMWEYFSFERAKAKKFLKDAEKEQQEGIQGQWQ